MAIVINIIADDNTSDEMKLMILEKCLEKVEERLCQEEMLSGYFDSINFEDESQAGLMREVLWYRYRLEESPVVLPFVNPRGSRLSTSVIRAHRRRQSCLVPQISVKLSALRVVKQLYEYHVMCLQDNALHGGSTEARDSHISEQCALTRDAAEIWRASLPNEIRCPERVTS